MSKEVVIVMGYNASGKTTYTKDKYPGYVRLNRDLLGGTVEDLVTKLNTYLANGTNSIVLDNTYPTIASRASVVKAAKAHKAKITCVHMNTSFEDAQLNACLRIIREYGWGKIACPEELKTLNNPNAFPPAALYHYRKQFQLPTVNEGFDNVIQVPFVRTWPKDYVNKALIIDYDGTLRESTGAQKYPSHPSEIKMLPGRYEVLKTYQDDGYLLLGASNQSGIARGSVTERGVVEVFEETNRRLGLQIEYLYCRHQSNPVICYCRKPAPGMGARFIEKYKLDPAKCIMIGDMTSDNTFAERCGFDYVDQKDFFG